MASKANNYLEFLKLVGKSKRIPRTGWVKEKVKNPESIAEHSFRVGVIAMILADDLLVNKEKLMKMALLHDLGETFTGDIVWTRGDVVDIKIRDQKEKEELKNLIKFFNTIDKGEEFIKIFKEMLLADSEEARIFWQIDKLEMAIQAFEYEEEQGESLDEFFKNADLFVMEPLLKSILNKIMKRRELRAKSVFKL